jgi:hypothetical protein
MKIQVLSVQVTTVPTAKGSYQVADVAFKNLTFQGKVEGKKIMSFGATKDSFGVLATAQPNDVFDVNVVKNDKGYNDWVSMTKGSADGQDTSNKTSPAPTGYTPAGNGTARTSTYETPEERAKKQVYIIRQSSLSNAIDTLAVASKSALKADEVIDLARKYESYVFGTQLELPFPKEEFPDMPQ